MCISSILLMVIGFPQNISKRGGYLLQCTGLAHTEVRILLQARPGQVVRWTPRKEKPPPGGVRTEALSRP